MLRTKEAATNPPLSSLSPSNNHKNALYYILNIYLQYKKHIAEKKTAIIFVTYIVVERRKNVDYFRS